MELAFGFAGFDGIKFAGSEGMVMSVTRLNSNPLIGVRCLTPVAYHIHARNVSSWVGGAWLSY